MKVIINGQERKIDENMTVLSLLIELGIEDKTMAAAINMEVVKKENWGSRYIRADDKIEFLHFVGGG